METWINMLPQSNQQNDDSFKACICYFLSNFYISLNDSPSKSMKNVLFHLKSSFRLYSHFWIFIFPFFVPVSHYFRSWLRKNLKVYHNIYCLNKNLITHFVWYPEKKIKYDIETLSIDRVLNMEHFHGKIMQKTAPKAIPRPLFKFPK